MTILALAIGLVCTSCFPKIANLSKGDAVPEVIATHVPREGEILVLPLWSELRGHIFRDPYIVPASAIGTSAARVPRRIGFYLDSWVCGGPPKFVVGYLVVTEEGTFLWSNVRGERVSEDGSALRIELEALMSGEEIGPRLRELMHYGRVEIGFHADKEERLAAVRFLERISDGR